MTELVCVYESVGVCVRKSERVWEGLSVTVLVCVREREKIREVGTEKEKKRESCSVLRTYR